MRRIPVVVLVLLLAAVPAFARRRSVRTPSNPDRIQHVFVVVLENADYSSTMSHPFMQTLASQGALLRNYYGLTHPSQPNYIGMTSGSLWGVHNDDTVTLSVPHLGDLVEARGLTWKTYAETYPGNCYTGDSYGSKSSGQYVRRHNPFIEYANVQYDSARCNAHIVNASEFDADLAAGSLPAFSFYVPNDRNNGHDTSSGTADQWLQSRFGPLLQDPRFTDGLLFIVTVDEDGSSNHVATVLWGPTVVAGSASDYYYDHYSLLRTIEDALHVGTLNQNDAAATPITDVLNVTIEPQTLPANPEAARQSQ